VGGNCVRDCRPPLLVLLVDAFRHDYLTLGETPFLSELAASGEVRPLDTILGYSDSVRATAFTGLRPDELGYWMEYRFRPEASPFRPFSSFGPLDRIPSDLALRALKLGLSRTVVPSIARRRGHPTLDLRHVPFGAMRFFDYTLNRPMTAPGALGEPTIFDRLSAAGLPWRYLDSSKVGHRGIAEGIATAPKDSGLLFVYLHHVDMASHLFGIDSSRFRSTLRRTDERVRGIVGSVRRRFGVVDTLVFSDHGMSPARSYRSLPELRGHPAFGSAFCFALDATMVRLWHLTDRPFLREELRDLVAHRVPGRFLSELDRRSLHFNCDHRDYGDEIFLAEPGVIIFPNFHSYVRPKAMHAYDPADPDQQGILIAAGDAPPIDDRVEMTDVHALMERMIGIADRPLVGARV
jgi:hypothetical protein